VRVAGIMSGTSLDGIDVAVVEVTSRQVRTIGFISTPYSAAVRTAILAVSGGADRPASLPCNTAAISRLNYQLGELYARAVFRAVHRYGPVELIGCHGQTIYHEGRSNTLQIGEPSILAERTGVPVVANFRARDIAAGGQGAPLVPYVDYLLFRHPKRTRIALNIGGIANITVIPPAARPTDVTAFDTGPGNMVIDALAKEFSNGKLSCDRGGRIAASGNVNAALLDTLLADPYYRREPPKSAGREQYGAEFVTRMKKSGLPLRDLVTTATIFTAATIAIAVGNVGRTSRSATSSSATSTDPIISGGGVHNPQIMAHLAGFLPGVSLSVSAVHGVDADAKEAVAFAVLAYRTWRRKPSNLPSATGAAHPVILGSITP
jgi:anhydro-N-acetylmuramic acid kinase